MGAVPATLNVPEASTSSVQTPTNSQAVCVLLRVLPAEIRLEIYKHLFQGSRRTWNERRRKWVSSKHCTLMLTCRELYHEAAHEYYAATTLDFQGVINIRKAWRPDETPESLDKLPRVAFERVRHVRGVPVFADGRGWGRAVRHLEAFRRLETCVQAATHENDRRKVSLPNLWNGTTYSPCPADPKQAITIRRHIGGEGSLARALIIMKIKHTDTMGGTYGRRDAVSDTQFQYVIRVTRNEDSACADGGNGLLAEQHCYVNRRSGQGIMMHVFSSDEAAVRLLSDMASK